MLIARSHIQKLVLTALVTALLGSVATNSYAQFPILSGIVSDPNGTPVNRADLDFDIAATGQRLITPGDNTDINGFYSVRVFSPTVYHVSFAPPLGTRLLGKQFRNFSLLGPVELDVTLDFGVVVSGTITDSLGAPVGNVDIDIDSLPTGRVYTPGDVSSLIDGSYRVVSPTGLFSVKFDPPPGSPWNGVRYDSVLIQGDTTLNVQFTGGVRVNGAVIDEFGAGVPDVGIEMRDPITGDKSYLSNDKTDSLGNYSVVAPSGFHTIRYAPPLGSAFSGQAFDSVNLVVDTTVDITLSAGHLISISVYDSSGAPIVGADLDATDELTRIRLFTPNDKTDALGQTVIAVATGLYEIKVDPPLGSILDQIVLRNVNISADTALEFYLPIRGVIISGRVVDQNGIGVQGAVIGSQDSTGDSLRVKFNTSLASGMFSSKVSPFAKTLTVAPPQGSRLIARRIENVALTVDTVFGELVLDSGVVVQALVTDESLFPATGYRLLMEVGSVPLFTPYNSVDESGSVTVVVPVGVYDIVTVDPFGERNLARAALVINSDTSLVLTLGAPSAPAQFMVGQGYPNPFNGATKIPYTLLEPSDIQIEIYNILGQRVNTINHSQQSPGYYEQIWSGFDDDNNIVASGMYFYKVITRFGSQTKRIIFLK